MRAMLCGGLISLCASASAAIGQVDVKVLPPPVSVWFARTPQLDQPLRPLDALPPAGRVRVRAMVGTIPDPTETHHGRTFDMVLASTLSAFQSQRYVLDGYAFPWRPFEPARQAKDPKEPPRDPRTYRTTPGVLLFRRDTWRDPKTGAAPPDYALVFLVGEAPTYGVHPEAFRRAARCAMAYNHARPIRVAALHVEQDCDTVSIAGTAGLDVLGPAFSGSMQSVAIALARAREPCIGSPPRTLLLSPSATVDSNTGIQRLRLAAGDPKCGEAAPEFYALAWSLRTQFEALRDYLCTLDAPGTERRVVVLAEESTFGRGAEELFKQMDQDCRNIRKPDDKFQFEVRTFSPDIASIRAEHSTLRRSNPTDVPGMPKVRSRLLELDMTATRDVLDRPTVYEPSLSSRSDELMLFRTFDTLRIYFKPHVVVILATDVRDRLFLLSEVRNALPSALPVMMELDYLSIHPDYRQISRGAVFVAAGDAVACLGRDSTDIVPCKDRPRRFPFATDYAANVFRAVVLLLHYRDARAGPTFAAFADRRMRDVSSAAPCLYVATLAGFQELSGHTGLVHASRCRSVLADDERPRSSMAAADTRMTAQLPAYLALSLLASYFILISGWVIRGLAKGRVLLPASRHVVLDGRWIEQTWDVLRSPLLWDCLRLEMHHLPRAWTLWRCKRRREQIDTHQHVPLPIRRWLSPGRVLGMMWVLFALAAIALLLSLWRLSLILDERVDYALAHGRDLTALACIWLIFSCACVVAFARLKLADHRIGAYARKIQIDDSYDPPTLSWLLPVLATLAGLYVVFKPLGMPISADPGRVWWIGLFVLAVGVAFLANVGRLLRMLGRVTLFISSATPGIRQYLREKDWPAPQVIHQMPQTPFNLNLQRDRDIRALCHAEPPHWGETTRQLVDDAAKGAQIRLTRPEFDAWQEQLVAELKACVVALRSCAWCALLAPLALLMAMSAYPPIFEPKLTTLAIAQLLISFGVNVYAVLRLEQDPMLGLMFTRDGDHLTFGGSLRALWPKFVAMAIVLLPLVLPNIWRWLNDLVRSVNSFS